MNLLFHVMTIAALVDQPLAGGDNDLLADDRHRIIKHRRALSCDEGEIIVLEIDNTPRQMGQRDSIRTNEAGVITKTDGQRRGISRDDEHVAMVMYKCRKA